MLIQRVINRLQNYCASTARRAICWVTCFALILSSSPASPSVTGKTNEKSNIYLTKGVPGRNLPNLDNARHMTSAIPKMLSQVSITKPSAQKNNITVDLLSSLFSSSFMGVGAAGSAVVAISDWFGSNDATVKKKESVKTIPSATKIAQPVSSVVAQAEGDNWPMALLDQKNRVGTGGEDLLSRNYSWGIPLVGLPGRAGMDLDLGLSYNSLVWTKGQTNNIHFNDDNGFPSPGFHMGLPEIRTYFHNPETDKVSILVIMPSGTRYEFRENPELGYYVYEEQTGTNMLMIEEPGLFDPTESVWRLLSPDGTTYTFRLLINDPKCVEVKDRNGNYISIDYTSFERISKITDTLGRVVNFNYDSNKRLISITQNWSGETHTWATFAYGNVVIEANFPGLDLVGVEQLQTIPVLSRVILFDGTVYAFEYNTYAQIHTIRKYAPNSSTPNSFPNDYTQLSYTSYDLPRTAAGGFNDCPRINVRTDWAKDWNNEEAVPTRFEGDYNSWGSVKTPGGVTYKEIFGTSGWQRGLTLQSETWYEGVKKKWTTATWKNDDNNLSYQLNPKVIETNVYDEQGNRKRTTIDYTDYNSVSDIREFSSNGTEVYRRTHIDYIRDPAYIDNLYRRMTNLVKSQTVYDRSDNVFSKVTYEYDLGGEYLTHQVPPVNHDSVGYGSSFNKGRGNVNVVRRWDVNDPNNIDKTLISKTGYNTSGSVIFTADGLGHKTEFSYGDSYSDLNNSRNTFAYVTTAKDPDGYSSKVQYNFDFSAITKTQNPKGATILNTFDYIGRLERVTNQANGAYTKYVFAPNQTSVQTYTTINDLNSEFWSISIFDGHGRLRAAASEHPNSTGGMKGQYFEYNNLGQQVRQTNPTEIDSNWNSVGDDAAGFAWSSQQYDWMGRPVISTNQDGSTKKVSYDACGCTGVNIITYIDEMGRRQKQYYDSFGQLAKSQMLNFDGSVYSTSANTYNLRGQILRSYLQEGENGASQETLMTYDGYGRIATKKYPIASTSSSFIYNADDTLRSETDARGVVTTYGYNNRKLITTITYGEAEGVISLAPITFGYDEVGNRLWMDDEPGRVVYSYNTLSQMEWEERRYDAFAGIYRLNYQYNLSGQLKEVIDFANDRIYYNHNKAGEIIGITGSSQITGNQFQYTSTAAGSQIKYYAWGGVKQYTTGNGIRADLTYNNVMKISNYTLSGQSSGSGMNSSHTYYADGRLKYSKDNIKPDFDRAYEWDHMGRLKEAYSGNDARVFAGKPQSAGNIPYRQSFQHDFLSNLVNLSGFYWGDAYNEPQNYDVATGRQSGWTYDAAGYLKQDDSLKYFYDAAGNLRRIQDKNGDNKNSQFDGDGKRIYYKWDLEPYDNGYYYVMSSPLGGRALIQITSNENRIHHYIYWGSERIATTTNRTLVNWKHRDPVTGSVGGSQDVTQRSYFAHYEYDPLGINIGLSKPSPPSEPSESYYDPLLINDAENPGPFGVPTCQVDKQVVPCTFAKSLVQSGAAVVGPAETTSYNSKIKRWEFFHAYADGTQGVAPLGHVPGRTYWYDYVINDMAYNQKTGKRVHSPGDQIIAQDIYSPKLKNSPETHFINVIQGDLIVGGFQQSKKTQPVKTKTPGFNIPFHDAWMALNDCYKKADERASATLSKMPDLLDGTATSALKTFIVAMSVGTLGTKYGLPAVARSIGIQAINPTWLEAGGGTALLILMNDEVLIMVNSGIRAHISRKAAQGLIEDRENCRNQVKSKHGIQFSPVQKDHDLVPIVAGEPRYSHY